MIYIGVDPGMSGGLACLGEDGAVLSTAKLPLSERDLLDLLNGWVGFADARAALERVRSSPQMGVASAFTFGYGYGVLKMALVAAAIKFDEVIPRRWQKVLGCEAAGVGHRELGSFDSTAKKNAHKRRAQELFPGVVITHAIADALLIAEYQRRISTGYLELASPVERVRRVREPKEKLF